MRVGQIPANKSPKKTKPHNINLLCGFFVPKNDGSGPSSDRKKTATDGYLLLCSRGISEQPQNHWSEKSSEETV